MSAFEIEVGGPSSFSSAPFLGVVDRDGVIAALRECLAVDGQSRLFGDYVLYMTVGLNGGTWPAGELGVCLSNYPGGEQTRCRVERISLMAYLPTEIGGPLNCLADYLLASGEMRWQGSVFRAISVLAVFSG